MDRNMFGPEWTQILWIGVGFESRHQWVFQFSDLELNSSTHGSYLCSRDTFCSDYLVPLSEIDAFPLQQLFCNLRVFVCIPCVFLQALFSSSSITTREDACTGCELWARGISWISPWVSCVLFLAAFHFNLSQPLAPSVTARLENGLKVRSLSGSFA